MSYYPHWNDGPHVPPPPSWLLKILLYLVVAFTAIHLDRAITRAHGHDTNHPGPYDEWMMSVMRPDTPVPSSCCGPADQFWAVSYTASAKPGIVFEAIVQGRDGAPNFPIDIPSRSVVWDRVNPTGRGVVWINVAEYGGPPFVMCFVPGSGA